MFGETCNAKVLAIITVSKLTWDFYTITINIFHFHAYHSQGEKGGEKIAFLGIHSHVPRIKRWYHAMKGILTLTRWLILFRRQIYNLWLLQQYDITQWHRSSRTSWPSVIVCWPQAHMTKRCKTCHGGYALVGNNRHAVVDLCRAPKCPREWWALGRDRNHVCFDVQISCGGSDGVEGFDSSPGVWALDHAPDIPFGYLSEIPCDCIAWLPWKRASSPGPIF